MHGLHALIHGLVGALDAENAPRAIETLADVRRLASLRSEPAFRAIPLAELATHGFEMLIRKGLDLGLQDAFLASPDYREYAEERKAAGLT